MAFHSVLAIASSVFVFPTSIVAQYTNGIRAVIGPLGSGLRQHIALLEISPSSPDFSPKAVRTSVSTAESALAPLAVSARLLKRDVSWGRFSGKDLDGMREKIQRLVMRAHGMNVFFSLADPTRERFPVTPAPSRRDSPSAGTPNAFRPSSLTRTEESPDACSPMGVCSHAEVEQHRGRTSVKRHPRFDVGSLPRSVRSHLHGTLFRRHHQHSYLSLLPGVHHHDNLREHVVGVFESQRYLNLESHHFAHPLAGFYTERSTALLHQSCEPLLRSCGIGLRGLDLWLSISRHNKWMFWCGGHKCFDVQQERLDALCRAYDELTRALETFRTSSRSVILPL